MEEIDTPREDYDLGCQEGFAAGAVVGAVFTAACYFIGRGIGRTYSDARDRHDLKKIAKNTTPK